MRSLLLIALVGILAQTADAKPLPAGLEITLVKGTIKASRAGASVSLGSASKLISAQLSDDGKTVQIKYPGNPDEGEDGDVEVTWPLRTIEGKLANAAGMRFQVKKKYADAIGWFTAAVQHHAQPVYITNLLSALSMAKKLDDADKVIATHGKAIAPWLAWRLAVDKELAALVDRPGTKALFPGGGKATSTLGGYENAKIAYSPAGFAATEVYTGLMMGTPDRSEQALAIVELASGTEVLRLPTETTCNEHEPSCKQSKFTAKNKKQRAIADAVLAKLGFVVVGDVEEFSQEPYPKAKDGRTFVDKDGVIHVVVGKKQIAAPIVEIQRIAFVPKAVVLIHKVGDGQTWELELTSVPTP